MFESLEGRYELSSDELEFLITSALTVMNFDEQPGDKQEESA